MLGIMLANPLDNALMQHTACIAFTPDGAITKASPLFLATMGYTFEQIKGEHHRIFCDAAEINTHAYRDFWQSLADGKSRQGTFKRLNAQGDDVWLEATYLPISNRRGKVVSVLKIASDISLSVKMPCLTR